MSIFSGIKDKITRYIEVHLDLMKVNLVGHTARLMSYLVFALLALFMSFCIMLFIGLGITCFFIDLGISAVGSFFITTAIFLLLLLIIILLRRSISGFFADSIVEILTEDTDEAQKISSKKDL